MDLADLPILTIVTFLPLVGAIAVAILPASAARPVGARVRAGDVGRLARPAHRPTCPAAAASHFEVEADWIPFFGIQYKLGADGLSVALVVLTTTLSWISILASFAPIQTRIKEYMVAFLVLEVGMIGVFLALDLFLFYIFWEIVLVPMYLIIGIWGGANRIYADDQVRPLHARRVAADARGHPRDGLRLPGGDRHLGRAPSTSRRCAPSPPPRAAASPTASSSAAFLAFFLAFAIKVPMFPFHTWLPDAHTEAPTAGSVILAAIMLKLGAYGFIRFAVPLFPDAAQTFAPAIIVLSLIAIIYGAIVALVQPDLKRLVAYSSVSHMGFVTLGIFVFTEQGIQGAILQMINHGLITGAPLPARRRHLRADPRPDDREDGRPRGEDAGLRGGLRILRVRLGRPARPVRASSASSWPSSGRSRSARRGRDRGVRDDPRRPATCCTCSAGSSSASSPSSSRASATT